MEEKPAVVFGDTFLSGDDRVMDVRSALKRRGRKHRRKPDIGFLSAGPLQLEPTTTTPPTTTEPNDPKPSPAPAHSAMGVTKRGGERGWLTGEAAVEVKCDGGCTEEVHRR
eukprot:scaffold47_cov234-Alexandrium_tamarense.AAC.2